MSTFLQLLSGCAPAPSGRRWLYVPGEVMTTRPYVCGAAYLDRMGDHCGACRFDPRKDCPITALYWDFLARQRERLAGNPRVAMPLRSLARRSEARRRADAETAERVRRTLDRGATLAPAPEA